MNRGIVLDEHGRGLGAGAVVAGGQVARKDVDADPAEVDRLRAAEIDRAMRFHARSAGISPEDEGAGGAVDGQFGNVIEDQGRIGRRPDRMPLRPGPLLAVAERPALPI